MKTSRHFRRRRGHQQGYMLLVIVMMLTVALIALTAEAPYEITQIKRDHEEDLIRRGKQYQRAIKLFYKRFGRYPVTLAELQNTQNVHFLRKLYKDPMSPDGEWRLIHLGEAKYPPKGFGYDNIPGAQSIGSPIGTGPAGTQAPGGGGGGGAILPGGMGGLLGMGSSGTTPTAGPASGGADQSNSNQPNTGGMTPVSSMSSSIGTGPQIGAPIIGVASKNTGIGIHEVNQRKKYNEWEFFYDPRYDIAAQMSIMPGGVGAQASPMGGQPSSFGPGSPSNFGPMGGQGPGQGSDQGFGGRK